ncbi:MAG: SemiSWEET family transporter [Nitrososphaerales archaeon]
MIDVFQIVGFIALIASSVGFFPQLIKTFKTKKAEDLSFYTLLLLMIATISWIAYGFSRSDLFIVWTNLIIFILVFMLAIMKISYKNSSKF